MTVQDLKDLSVGSLVYVKGNYGECILQKYNETFMIVLSGSNDHLLGNMYFINDFGKLIKNLDTLDVTSDFHPDFKTLKGITENYYYTCPEFSQCKDGSNTTCKGCNEHTKVLSNYNQITSKTDETEPPCLCKSYHYHEPGCAYKAWQDLRRKNWSME